MTNATENIAALRQAEHDHIRSRSLLQKALWRLWHDPLTLAAIGVIIVLAILCFTAPLIVEHVLDIEYNNPDLYNNYLPIGARVSDSNSTVFLFDAESGEELRPFIGHRQPVEAVAFSSDNEHFITGDDDGSIRTWHIPTGRNKRKIEEHEGAITDLDVSADGTLFVSASADGTARLWEVDKAVQNDPDIPLLVMEGHAGAVTATGFSPDDTTVATGGEEGNILLWDVASGDLLSTLQGHTGAITDLAFSHDSQQILTSSADGTARLWDISNGEQVQVFEGHEGAVNSVAFGEDGSTVLTAGADATARLWDKDSAENSATFTHPESVTTAAFIPGSTLFVSGSTDGITRIWDLTTGEVTRTLDTAAYPVHGLAVSPDGTEIVTGSEGRRRQYILGTDSSGRDHLSRLLFGGQISLTIGFLSAIGSITIGIIIGVTAGYFGGIIDDAIVWLITTLNSIPQLFLLLIISAMLAPNAASLILVLVFLLWTGTTRIMRGETIALRDREFVIAARAIGAGNFRIMFLHIVPNVISLLLIVMSRAIGGLILTESTLSFLGFGVKPPTPTWGNMLSGGLDLLREAPHLVFAPGLLISLTVLCLYIIGDGLRDAFDPRLSD
jgi:peptide/nickel transport system permease protein